MHTTRVLRRAFVLFAQLYGKAAVVALAEVADSGTTVFNGGLAFDPDFGRLTVLVRGLCDTRSEWHCRHDGPDADRLTFVPDIRRVGGQDSSPQQSLSPLHLESFLPHPPKMSLSALSDSRVGR